MTDAQHLELNPMRNAIVNAGRERVRPAFAGPAGSAAPVSARAGDLRVLARCLVVITLTTGMLAFNASELWPHLFHH
jgi:hypothetical protein